MNKTQLSFAEGWTVFYQARTVFVVMMVVAMVINLGIFGTARFAKKLILFPQPPMLSNPPVENPAASRPAPSLQPTAIAVDAEASKRSDTWKTAFTGLMTFSAILSLVSVIFLVFCAVIGIMMIIAGQFPGAGFIAGAFFWSVGLVAMLLPWSTMLPLSSLESQISWLPLGVVFFRDINSSIFQTRLSNATLWMEIALWLRFVVYPIIILLMSLMYYKRTSQANDQILSDQVVGISQ